MEEAQGKLPESIEAYLDPGYSLYSLGVYHQLHCLNRIRKSFYRDKLLPNDDDEEFNFHKNHCFDVLRQAILCYGDTSLVYWWKREYTDFDDEGNIKGHSDKFSSLGPKERFY
ncbi:hypothetical protein VF21_10406 [Pseudogymnoascus sp. 05NY08]|nr:hypothetical protein VF21_10406 [Pseudogymnoascus sp. 05NY08]